LSPAPAAAPIECQRPLGRRQPADRRLERMIPAGEPHIPLGATIQTPLKQRGFRFIADHRLQALRGRQKPAKTPLSGDGSGNGFAMPRRRRSRKKKTLSPTEMRRLVVEECRRVSLDLRRVLPTVAESTSATLGYGWPSSACGLRVEGEPSIVEITCRRCGKPIESNEIMVSFVVGETGRWLEPARAARRLAFSPARWHIECAPGCVRQRARVGTMGLLSHAVPW